MLADRVRMGSGSSHDDKWGTPGPLILANGTMQEGYFGLVTSSQFITGDALASAVTLSAGTSQFSTTDWFKFASKGKILFSPMKTIRNRVAWSDLRVKGLVWGDGKTGGDRTVQVRGFTFIVRLFRGLNPLYDPKNDPPGYSGSHCFGSEWNRLILPLHVGAKTGSWGSYGNNVESGLPYWGTDFSNSDLQVVDGDGGVTLCQNVSEGISGQRCTRGLFNVASSTNVFYEDGYARNGWRPVLELIP